MRRAITSVLVFSAYFCCATAGTTLDASQCGPNSGVTALPNCEFIGKQASTCNNTLPASDRIECECTEQVFNAFVGCGNEMRLCLGSGDYDSLVEDAMSNWHDTCDQHVSTPVTTPIVSTITEVAAACTSMFGACETLKAEVEKCNAGAASSASACMCAPKLLTAEYNCLFIGNMSCVKTDATLSEVVGYSFCSNFQSVLDDLVNGIITATATGDSASTPFPTWTLGSITVSQPTATTSSSMAATIMTNMLVFISMYFTFIACVAII